MEISWSTFLLEIVNFLVLVWILKHFLYEPVLDIIAKRRANIEKTLNEAKAIEADAKTLQARYDSRLSAWEAEQREAREALAREIDKERASRMTELRKTLDQERQSAQSSESQRLAALQLQYEQTALDLGARFAAQILKSSASPELQARLVDKVLDDLATLPSERAADLTGNPESPPREIAVTSAFALPAEQRTRLVAALAKATELDLPVRFEEDPTLLAGLSVRIGASDLGLNLRDELRDFAKVTGGPH